MTTFIKTRNSDGRELCRTLVTDNWFSVYQTRAMMEGRTIRWLSNIAYNVVFSEKDYTVTLIKQ